ncbi:PREDICTED: protein-lysine methyltransferase METTL21C [Myotis brandtii]|uniref:protein-lysine methyltransferase METTL21C n=1 Tax=Myotis brandtii TaxID=109478 RepID=UPI000703DE41|nr:PREDICTED: protein-lysine methyltransferase METTL21C [Myotis brandtii]
MILFNLPEIQLTRLGIFQAVIRKISIYGHPLVHRLMDPEAQKGDREDNDDKEVVAEIMARCFFPALVTTIPWEGFHFVGHEIRITEAMDCYGAVVWPSIDCFDLAAFSDMRYPNLDFLDLQNFFLGTSSCAELQYACRLEAGLFTLSHEGYFSTALCFTGAHVTATDLPELLGNLQYNISRNTKMKCKHLPQVKELSWGIALDKNFPRSSNNFDYILAADVVYAHPFLEELLITFDHLCKEATIILWVMKFRLEKENKFVDRFKELFDLEEISSFPSLNIKLYKAMKKNRRSA